MKDAAKRVALDAAGRAAILAEGALEETLESTLDFLTETVPRFLRRLFIGLSVAGLVAVGLGVFALVSPDLFRVVMTYVVGGLLIVGGIGLWWLAMRIADATATLRGLLKLLKRFRDRRAGT